MQDKHLLYTATIENVRRKLHLINVLYMFVILVFMALVLGYFHPPVREAMEALPENSLRVIVGCAVVLGFLASYISRVLGRQTVAALDEYNAKMDHMIALTSDFREDMSADEIIKHVITAAMDLTGASAGGVLVPDKLGKLAFKGSGGQWCDMAGHSVGVDATVAGWAFRNGRGMTVNDPALEPDLLTAFAEDPEAREKRLKRLAKKPASALKEEGADSASAGQAEYAVRNVMAAPLVTRKGPLAVIELVNKQAPTGKKGGMKPVPFDRKDEEILEYIAGQAAYNVERARFYEEQRNYETAITEFLATNIEYTIGDKGHCRRVARYATALGRAAGLQDLRRLHAAALLHKIGTLRAAVDDKFADVPLDRQGEIGADTLGAINFYRDLAPIVRHVEDWYDGSGTRKGREAGANIPVESRIIAIAEAFDAFFSGDSAGDASDAGERLRRQGGKRFDPKLVDLFIEQVRPIQE
jgi:HD-GYP domain-containing protein (c-di-GMP phosphodiesterase class II)